ncbi:MAG: Fe-S protein assembly co-chaperone HscB [Pseudomonadota bacterium]|nr:Fe-S protein assembly co-chaperone HscB [Pseudomonadota bacterium]
MNLQATDFELFAVPVRFAQDAAMLDARWKELQRQVHPDKFAAEGPAAQRVAAQWSARINEAHRRLKDPQRRAAYLCELHGAPIDAERNTAMPPAFLMQQMELRELLDDAASAAELDTLSQQVAAMQRGLLADIERHIDTERDWPAAAQSVRALMFLDKLLADIDRRHEALP